MIDILSLESDFNKLTDITPYGYYEIDYSYSGEIESGMLYKLFIKILDKNEVKDVSSFLKDFSKLLSKYNIPSYMVIYETISHRQGEMIRRF